MYYANVVFVENETEGVISTFFRSLLPVKPTKQISNADKRYTGYNM